MTEFEKSLTTIPPVVRTGEKAVITVTESPGTFLKQLCLKALKLPDSQKVWVQTGEVLAVQAWKEQSCHYYFTLEQGLNYQGRNSYWIYTGHCRLEGDASHNGSNAQTSSVRLLDAFRSYQKLPDQDLAIAWLESKLSHEQRQGFGQRFLNNQTSSEANPVVPEVAAKAVFEMKLYDSDELLLGQLTFYDQQSRQIFTCVATSGLPACQGQEDFYKSGRGPIPPIQGLAILTDGFYSDTRGVEGMFFPIVDEDNPDQIPYIDSTYRRGDFGLHFDANAPGSAGCIVVRDRNTFENQVVPLMKEVQNTGLKVLKLEIDYGQLNGDASQNNSNTKIISIKLLDAFRSYQKLPEQDLAITWLEGKLSQEQQQGFEARFLNNPTGQVSPPASPEQGLYGGSSGKLPLSGLAIIKEFEGFYPNAYPDPQSGGKPYTIGYGSTKKKDGSDLSIGDTITQEQAEELLIYQLEHDYLPSLAKIPVWQKLNANQQGALLSFGYNLGAGFYEGENFQTITRVLNTNQWDQIESTLLLYRSPGTSVEQGLKRRRLAEAKLFLTPVNTSLPTSFTQKAEVNQENKNLPDSSAFNPQANLWLNIIHNTIAKQSAVRSEELPDAEKEIVSTGHKFQILNYHPVVSKIGPHIGVTLAPDIKIKGRSTWVFYQPHIEIVQDNGRKVIGQHSANDLLPPSVNLPVPYFSQRDNQFRPEGTCNVTSVAMCLSYYAIRPQNRDDQLEDELFQLCEEKAWDRHVHDHLLKVFQTYGIYDRFKMDATWQEVKAHLANKNPVIYSGNLTDSGHIIVLRGYDDTGFWVNDPNGEYFSSGYQNKSGENLHYSYNLLKRVSLADGSDRTWAHFPEKR